MRFRIEEGRIKREDRLLRQAATRIRSLGPQMYSR